MTAYRKFAYLYDTFMEDIPYGQWRELVVKQLTKYGVPPQKEGGKKSWLLELGCGTGNMAKQLCSSGYRVTGIDLSMDMVKVASAKKIPGFRAERWDMRIPYMEEGKGYDGIISVCDSMNYLISKGDIQLTFRAAAANLRENGIFLFDLKTDAFYRTVLGNETFAETRENCSYIWENSYDEKHHINEYEITFYRRVFGPFFERFREHHVQRAYSKRQIAALAEKEGLELLECIHYGERDYYIMKGKN